MPFLKNIFFSFLVFLVCLCLLELGLSLVYHFPNGYFVATPQTSFVWEKDSLKKGIYHDALVSFDKWGSRSTSSPNEKSKAIITIGGSTTACYSLDQPRTWTALLEDKLGEPYWVANFGKPGNFSTHHVIQLEHISQDYDLPKIDKVLIMMGKNDFSAGLINQEKYLSLTPFETEINAFKHQPDSALPWFRTLAIAKLFKRTKHNIIQLYRRKSHGEELQECSKARLQTTEVNELPDLSKALKHYESNAMKMIQFAKLNNIDLVFISQAVLWNTNLSPSDSKLICSCDYEKNIHYSLGALANGMELFNKRLEAICHRENVPFIWNNIESNSSNFFDDCHYTEKGAQLVAEEVYKGLSKNKEPVRVVKIEES